MAENTNSLRTSCFVIGTSAFITKHKLQRKLQHSHNYIGQVVHLGVLELFFGLSILGDYR
ncbi:hypothetical protein CRP01_09205 [Flavilitoribacter nigricans DSM 23189 = NBRC 102662]|uniref:Uncharacterized protein n=1 Tax=Flavilitoribacter nigricans (strain ATCC 23147 / DSM 23189 / NBRC 102662 / NCIMB 1420 / SS-2) TaxID=1122177 RepID=A0A2D0NEQ7_FLAN2|nr:hypothetical protein CRP01_09205 [Flavilitoribacter nigricans DSM 23189 = NBRC 102662]